MTIERAGRLVPPAWLHAHRARLTGILLLRGAHQPSDFGRAADGSGGLSASCQLDGRPECASVAALREAIRAESARAGGLICHDNETAPTYAVRRGVGAAVVAGGPTSGPGATYYDRQGQLLCEPHAFEAAEQATVFAFTSARWAAAEEHFGMHTMLFTHFLPSNASTLDIERVSYAQPSNSYGVWDLPAGTFETMRNNPTPLYAR